MKKIIAVLTCLMLLASYTLAFAQEEPVTIYWSQWQVEYTDALAHLLAEYEAQHQNVHFEIDMAGGDASYKTLLAADQLPDVIMTIGGGGTKQWLDYLEPLTDQPCWTELTDYSKSWLTFDGEGYGVPVTMLSYGFIYNKDLFAKAGISQTPRTWSELVSVVDQLEQAGITPFSTMFADTWYFGHFASEMVCDYVRNHSDAGWDDYYAKLCSGEMTFNDMASYFDPFFNAIDLMKDHDAYSPEEALAGTQNRAFADLATGQAAMLYIGGWAMTDLYAANPDANLGIFGTVYSDDPADYRLSTDINCAWHVTKGEHADICIDVLNWMCSDPTALDILHNEFGIISPYKDTPYTLTDTVSQTTSEALSSGEVQNWLMNGWASQAQPESTFADIQSYLLGDINRTECLDLAYERFMSYLN